MAFNRENIARIRAEYTDRRRYAAEESERKKQALYKTVPELESMDREMSSVGLRAMQLAMEGGDVEAAVAALKGAQDDLRARRAALLLRHGYPADYTDIRYQCEQCLDTGFVGTKMCACMRRALILAGYESSGLGALMQTQTFDSFSLKYYAGKDRETVGENLQTLRQFAENFRAHRAENYLLAGPTGLGKTHLSTAVACTVIESGFDVVYDTAQGMFGAFESARFGRGESTVETTDRYLSCELLILDDLGTEMTNTFTVSCLYNVINTRLSRGLSTIINTNLVLSELRQRYADRITSRLFGEFRILQFAGMDIRAQKLRE